MTYLNRSAGKSDNMNTVRAFFTDYLLKFAPHFEIFNFF